MLSDYEILLKNTAGDLSGLKILFNGLYGVATTLPLSQIFESLGASVGVMNWETDGSFSRCVETSPDPTMKEHITPLIEAVRKGGYDIGIGFDGDGDRLVLVDNSGEEISGDIVLSILVKDVVGKNQGRVVVYDAKCSEAVTQIVKAAGGIPLRWKTGFAKIKQKMQEVNAVLAGEQSGHFFFADYYNIDDGIYGAARFLRILAKAKKEDSKFAHDLAYEISHYPSTRELRVKVTGENANEEKKRIIAEAKAYFIAQEYTVDETDGLRIIFNDGWALARVSSNEPKIICRAEGYTEEALKRIATVFFGKMRQYERIDFSKWNEYLDELVGGSVDNGGLFADASLKPNGVALRDESDIVASVERLPYSSRAPPFLKIIPAFETEQGSNTVIELAQLIAKGITEAFPFNINVTIDPSITLEDIVRNIGGYYDTRRRQFVLPYFFKGHRQEIPTLVITEADITGLRQDGQLYNYLFGRTNPSKNIIINSAYRLQNQDIEVFIARNLRNAVHEVGHLIGGLFNTPDDMRLHCDNSSCVMHLSHNATELDRTAAGFCSSCAAKLQRLAERTALASCSDNGGLGTVASTALEVKLRLSDEESADLRNYVMQTEREGLASKLFSGKLTWWDTVTKDWIDNKSRLGWLDILSRIQEARIPELEELSRKLKADGLTTGVILGIGGSGNGMVALKGIFGLQNIYILGSVEPQVIRELEERLDLEHTVFFVISKSWTTVEITKLKDYFYQKLLDLYGGDKVKTGSHFVAVADPKEKDGDAKDVLRTAEKPERCYRAVIDHDQATGGRYASFFAEPGLVPAAFADDWLLKAVTESGAKMMSICQNPRILDEDNTVLNPGLLFGLFIAFMETHGKTHITYVLPAELKALSTFFGQITAESLGKKDSQGTRRGVIPVILSEEEDLEPAYYKPQRNFFVHFKLGVQDNRYQARMERLRQSGFSVIEIVLPAKEEIGQLVAMFNIGIAIAGNRMGVNFADEPGVWVSKDTVLCGFVPYFKTNRSQGKGVSEILASLRTAASSGEECRAGFQGGTLDYGYAFRYGGLNQEKFDLLLRRMAELKAITYEEVRQDAACVYACLLILAAEHNKTYADLLIYGSDTQFLGCSHYWFWSRTASTGSTSRFKTAYRAPLRLL
jgi:predicted Zn-dependent protease/glucose-6-phosphate isomerase